MSHIFTLGFAAQVVLIAVPFVLAALCGAITERAGVVDLALEAKLLFGAFTAAAVSHATGSPWLGLVGGSAAGVAVAGAQAWCALRLGADQIITGIALNVVALSGTRLLLQLIYDEGANSPPCPGFGDTVVGSPVVWLAIVAAVVVPLAVERTRWGIRLRAAGDRPEALVAAGVSPTRARVAVMIVGGALAGAGGAQLALAIDGFHADMSNGRGYFAVGMVILSGWRPARAAIASVGFALAIAVGIQLQLAANGGGGDLASLLPYVLTVAVMVIAGGRRPPAALGGV
jgi:general nucleoside transport system permease protein